MISCFRFNFWVVKWKGRGSSGLARVSPTSFSTLCDYEIRKGWTVIVSGNLCIIVSKSIVKNESVNRYWIQMTCVVNASGYRAGFLLKNN